MRNFVTIILSLVGFVTFAQGYKVPAHQFQKESDYAQYNSEILQCIDWLAAGPEGQNIDQRNAATQFFVEWLTGTPDVSLELLPQIIIFNPEDGNLLMAYMLGWAKFALQNPRETDQVKLNAAALRSVVQAYKKGKSKDSGAEKLAALDQKGKLENWIKEQLEKK